MIKSSLTASDILNDIEFELLQGSISQNELGQSIQLVRQHQNKIRQELFGSDQTSLELREALSKQFQINDMLITMMQEMAGSLQTMQQTISRLGQRRQENKEGTTAVTHSQLDIKTSELNDQPFLRPTDDIIQTMQVETIFQDMDIQPNNRPLPFINGLMRRLRVGLHSAILYYVNRLVESQTAVNKTQADWILHLNALHRHQQEELEILTTKLAELQQQLSDHSQ